MSKYTVYMHIAPNGKKYIGITCKNVANRWGKDGNGYKGNLYFWRAINKYGWDNVIHQIVATELTAKEAKKREIDLIASNETRDPEYGYNLTDGGDGTCGYRHSEETKKKIGDMSRGNKYCLGREATAETKEKQSRSHKGAVVTEESRAKMSAALIGNQHLLGHKHTDETRAKMSASHMGLTVSEETREKTSQRMMGNKYWAGRKHSEETIEKMREAAKNRPKGYKHTAQARANMGASHIGSKRTEETRQKMRDARNAFIRRAQAANKGAGQ